MRLFAASQSFGLVLPRLMSWRNLEIVVNLLFNRLSLILFYFLITFDSLQVSLGVSFVIGAATLFADSGSSTWPVRGVK